MTASRREYFVSLADASSPYSACEHSLWHSRKSPDSAICRCGMRCIRCATSPQYIENVRGPGALEVRPLAMVNTKTSEWQVSGLERLRRCQLRYSSGNQPGPFGSRTECRPWLLELGDGADVSAGTARATMRACSLLDVPTTWEMRDLHVWEQRARKVEQIDRHRPEL